MGMFGKKDVEDFRKSVDQNRELFQVERGINMQLHERLSVARKENENLREENYHLRQENEKLQEDWDKMRASNAKKHISICEVKRELEDVVELSNAQDRELLKSKAKIHALENQIREAYEGNSRYTPPLGLEERVTKLELNELDRKLGERIEKLRRSIR